MKIYRHRIATSPVTIHTGLDLQIVEYDATFHRHIARAGVTLSSCMSPEARTHHIASSHVPPPQDRGLERAGWGVIAVMWIWAIFSDG